jgi:tRNA (uracil-5-)-methyltransferase TRM9
VQPEIIHRLLEINARFYQEYAAPFSATRQRLQPGVQRVLSRILPDAAILDLGCGNGEFWRCLSQSGFGGSYTGLDFSPQLLEIARENSRKATQTSNPAPVFQQADIATTSWAGNLPGGISSFTLILAFAVLHHIPSVMLRKKVIQDVRRLLDPHGQFIHSEWQFLNSSRLCERIQPWSAAGLCESDVEEGDFLLDWRREGRGLRYVHLFTPAELESLAQECGFNIWEQFSSDGEGGRLGLYQTWEPDLNAWNTRYNSH